MDAIPNASTTRMRCQATKRLQGHKHHGPPGIGSGIVRPKESLELGSGPPEDGHTGDLHRRPWREPLRSNLPSIRYCLFILPLMLWLRITSTIYNLQAETQRFKRQVYSTVGNLSRLQVCSSTLVSIEIVAGIEIFFVKEIQHVVLRRGDCLTFTHTKTTAIFYTIERFCSTR